jgi:hypothetical protein
MGGEAMKRSTDRILTTHAGRLPSPPDVMDTVRAIQRGEPHDWEAFGGRLRAVTAEVVRQQGEAGVDVMSDGEIGRIGPFWGRLAGYRPRALKPGEDPRQAGTPRGEWKLFPDPRANRHLTLDEYRRAAILRVDALNHALQGIPEERLRHHVCWGSW